MPTNEEKLSKKTVLGRIKDMPARLAVDELMERMVVVGRVERGRREWEAGKGLSPAHARKKLAKALK